MVKIYPFSALHPPSMDGDIVPSVPYDVISREAAKKVIGVNPFSFLRVTRPDAELTELRPSDPAMYESARCNFQRLISEGHLVRDGEPFYYVYKIFQNGKIFYGLCSSLSVDDYIANRIRKHELTTYDKEEDRTRHIRALKAHAGPVVLVFRDNPGIHPILTTAANNFSSLLVRSNQPDGSIHEIYTLNSLLNSELTEKFSQIDSLYIADGHHRAKSAVNVALEQRINGERGEEGQRFLGVLFPDTGIDVYAYHRLIADIGKRTPDGFLMELSSHFEIVPYKGQVNNLSVIPPLTNSDNYHVFHLYIKSFWYECRRLKDQGADRISGLDVSVIQSVVFEGMLGITDPRGDQRLRYIGGVHPLIVLEKAVDNGEFILGFAMQPIKVSDVIGISDDGDIMPPKSTWFEPKLLCGLSIHTF